MVRRGVRDRASTTPVRSTLELRSSYAMEPARARDRPRAPVAGGVDGADAEPIGRVEGHGDGRRRGRRRLGDGRPRGHR